MTPKIIELQQAPVVLVELPKGCKHEKLLGKSGDGTFLLWDITNNFDDDNRPHGQILIDTEPRNRWRILGILSDLTEDKFSECVDSWESVWNDGSKVYENYKDPVPKKRTAKKSFYSLLESENVYTENPYGEKAPVNNEFYWGYLNDFEQWQEAQSRTIDPKRTVVLVKKED